MTSPITIYVCDTETVGKDAGPNRIVELAMIPVYIADPEKSGPIEIKIDEAFESFVKPGEPISFGAMATHHVTEAEVASAPSLGDALLASPLVSLPKPPVLVAHNAAFDAGFLEDGLSRMPWSVSDVTKAYWLDTWRSARHVLKGVQGYSNQSLRYELGLNHPSLAPGGAHRALSDALVTALLLERLLALKSLRELCAVQNEPILIEQFGFGKHRGQPMSEVPADYLRWLWLKSDMGKDEKFTAEMEIRRRNSTAPLHVDSGTVTKAENVA